MQNIRNSILSHLRLRVASEQLPCSQRRNVFGQLYRKMCASSGSNPDEIMDRVIGLVKKFDKMDASKVTKTADFQKDLGLDSLDRVELVMAFEQEFSIEISDEKADKLTCCAGVAKYIASQDEQKVSQSS
ncbi:mitochondrial acyl carrier protein 3 [Euphorbia peplus]|nr:mitochondrial acyl carrier protein 3 [Euphorbia peplus]